MTTHVTDKCCQETHMTPRCVFVGHLVYLKFICSQMVFFLGGFKIDKKGNEKNLKSLAHGCEYLNQMLINDIKNA